MGCRALAVARVIAAETLLLVAVIQQLLHLASKQCPQPGGLAGIVAQDAAIVIHEGTSRIWTGLVQEKEGWSELAGGAPTKRVAGVRDQRPAFLPAAIVIAAGCVERIEGYSRGRNHAAVSGNRKVAAGFENVHVCLKRHSIIVL